MLFVSQAFLHFIIIYYEIILPVTDQDAQEFTLYQFQHGKK